MKNLAAWAFAELAAVSRRRMGGPVVAPHMSWHPGILPWRVTSWCCLSQMGVCAWWRTDRVVAVRTEVIVREARYGLTLSHGRLDAGSSYP